MKRFLVFLLSFVIGLLLFYWVIKWVGWKEIKEILFTFSGYKGGVILALTILIWLVGLWRWKFVIKSQGYDLSFLSLVEIFFAAGAINYFFSPPVYFGGEIFRVYAAKKKFSLPQEKNLAVIAIEKILSASIFLLFLIFGFIAFFLLAEFSLRKFEIITIVLIGFLAIGLSIFYFRSFKKESILKHFFRFLGVKNNKIVKDIEKKMFSFFDFKKSFMWKGLGIVFLNYLLILARCWFLVFFLTGKIGILIPLVVLLFLFLSLVLPFPAKLGGLEITQAFVFGSLGLGTATGITFSFIIRGTETLVALFGLFFLVKLGMNFFYRKSGGLKI